MNEQIPLGAALAGLVVAVVPGVVGLVYAVGAYIRAKTAILQATLAAKESLKTNVLLEEHKSQAAVRNEAIVNTLAETKAVVEDVKKATNGMKDELVAAAYEAGKSGAPKPVNLSN